MMSEIEDPKKERTLVLIKPDGVRRALTGQVISRFEQRGLKIVALKMVLSTAEHADKHYVETDEWLEGLGQKTHDTFEQFGWDVAEHMGTVDKREIGKMIKKWLVEYFTEGPMVAMVVEGMHAVSTVRMMAGHTVPIKAAPGTIRGDYSVDSNTSANLEKRVVKNVIHISGSIDEAQYEIGHWFSPEEIHDYSRADESVMFSVQS